jgi:hypothetical protein
MSEILEQGSRDGDAPFPVSFASSSACSAALRFTSLAYLKVSRVNGLSDDYPTRRQGIRP